MPSSFRARTGLRTIRHRLALILALPTCALVVLAGLGTAAQATSAGAAGHTSDQVVMVIDTEAFVAELQRERGLTAGLLGGDESFRPRLAAQRGTSDLARAVLDRQLGAGNAAGAAAIRTALGGLSGLSSLRGRADSGTVDTATALAYYTDAITAITDAAFSGTGSGPGIADDRLRADLATLRSLGDTAEATALERGTLNGTLAAGRFSGDAYPAFVRILATRTAALAQVRRTATDAQLAALDSVLRSPAATTVSDTEQQVLTHYRDARLPVAAGTWWTAASALVDALHRVQSDIGQDSRARAAALRSDAQWQLGVDVGLALLAILVAAALGLAATRSITRPLSQLAQEADDLAERALPQAVALVQGAAEGEDPAALAVVAGSALTGRGDEIAQVAGALDRVAGTALRLAVQQAALQRNSSESLASLGRRNQGLVTRQLGFLSSLERNENDPAVLANLFELDHLATRMRRNAESVLVLAGERSPRRWAQPIAMGDVVRAALGEVENYRQVVLRQVDEAMLNGDAVAEVAHLLAELIENALAASAATMEVELYAHTHGPDYLVAIVDHGCGLAEENLTAANLRLSGAESFLVGRTRLLGHYVVGQLSARLGAQVRLAPSPVAGVTASVLLPGSLFDQRAAAPALSGAMQ